MSIPRDAIVGICLLLFAGLYWWGAERIPDSSLSGGVGADGLPKALAYALAALALILIVRSLALRTEAQVNRASPEEIAEARRRHWRAFGMFAIGLAYLLALPYLGYFVSIVLLVGAAAWYNGKPISPPLVAVAIGTGVFFFFLFVKFLDIGLPAGFWPSLTGSFGA